VKGADLQLTHWTGNTTPDELYADLYVYNPKPYPCLRLEFRLWR
jgi:hypothetical protein